MKIISLFHLSSIHFSSSPLCLSLVSLSLTLSLSLSLPLSLSLSLSLSIQVSLSPPNHSVSRRETRLGQSCKAYFPDEPNERRKSQTRASITAERRYSFSQMPSGIVLSPIDSFWNSESSGETDFGDGVA